jgi:hypothetical protein
VKIECKKFLKSSSAFLCNHANCVFVLIYCTKKEKNNMLQQLQLMYLTQLLPLTAVRVAAAALIVATVGAVAAVDIVEAVASNEAFLGVLQLELLKPFNLLQLSPLTQLL